MTGRIEARAAIRYARYEMSTVDTIRVTLEPNSAKAFQDSVDAEDYPSVEDAMQDAIRLWRSQRTEMALASIRARIERSQSDPRPSLSSKEVNQRLEALFAAERA